MNANDRALAHGSNGAVVRQIKAEAAANGLTLDELARSAGIGPRTFARYISFERAMNLAQIEAVAEALGLDVPTLIRRAQDRRD